MSGLESVCEREGVYEFMYACVKGTEVCLCVCSCVVV